MRPFHPPLAVPPKTAGTSAATANGDGAASGSPALAGPVTYQHDPPALFGTESLAQALRQLEVYGHDGLPVLSADGKHVDGWITGKGVLRAIARQISTSQAETVQAQAAADWDQAGQVSSRREPPAPLPGYRLIELTINAGSPAAGASLGSLSWPLGSAPVSLVRDHRQRAAGPATTLHPGDRILLLTPAPQPEDKPGSPAGQPAGR